MSCGEREKSGKTEHTPEPWRVSEWFLNDKDGALETYGMQIVDSNNNLICAQTIESSATEEEETLRRIVACVNACAGISTEALESEGSAVMGWNRTASKLIHATKQRDELLEALEDLAVRASRAGVNTRMAYAAIASVKGRP